VAAAFGLPFAFASHFAPAQLFDALAIYRQRLQPSRQLSAPYAMLGVNVVAADTDEEARWLASSGRQAFASLRAGHPIRLPPPSKEWTREAGDADTQGDRTRVSFVGTAGPVVAGLEAFVAETGADEVIVVSHIYDHQARLHSYGLVAPAVRQSA
jgi:luciferase family oxidoreductase group 1